MNYRHAFHAGNFSDVFKHSILTILVTAFFRKNTPFFYLDTHAGVGFYDLFAPYSQKTKEYEQGIERIIQADNPPLSIQSYLNYIKKINLPQDRIQHYPGSPSLVKQILRPQDRMAVCELHPADYQTLKKCFANDRQVAVHHQDGYQSMIALLPPKEKRGLILIDPPYEETREWLKITTILTQALKRFKTGVYAVWYPIKGHISSLTSFYHELKINVTQPILINELILYSDEVATHLNGCGMLIINPPFQCDQALEMLLPWLGQALISTPHEYTATVRYL